ncbi:MAG: hypothetical protein PHT53_07390, partial [Candidatus Omnitrophica bacterium]|nr:hypothetical protein [Candidatus Omnitrophota bacterium]
GDFSTFNSPLVMNQGQVGIGTDPFPTMQGGGLLFLSHPYVSMVLVESDRARDQGGLWSIPLDGGILRFDVNTSAANDFSTHNTPLLMTQGGLIGMGLTDLVGRWNLAQLTINHWGVPLAFNETGAGAAAVNSGGLWHMPLDAGILRFDVNTSAAGDFASFRTTLLMYPDGSIRFPGNNGGAGLYVGSNGSVGIGTLAPAGTSSTASGILTMGFASAQPTATAGATHIFTGADGEGYWMDSAGNTTRQTPHDPETGEWVFFSKNVKTGRIVKVNMEQLVKEVERLSGKKFMSENAPGN